jgi:hypothetical protein
MLTRQETVPRLVDEFRVLGKLSTDHELLDAVDRVDVVHAVDDNTPDLLETLVRAHGGDGVPLHEDVTVGEELNGLGGRWSAIFRQPEELGPLFSP